MFKNLFSTQVLSNSISAYFLFFLTFSTGIIAILFLKSIFLKKLKSKRKKTGQKIRDFIVEALPKDITPLALILFFNISFQILNVSNFLTNGIFYITLISITFFGIRFITKLILFILEGYFDRKDTTKKNALRGIFTIIKVAIWGLGIILLCDNLGIKISALVAGLGIGGIAIALAAQAVLGDLFSYFTILFDRPFEVGDFIIIGDFLGGIEHIGIKTTRIRSLSGEQLVFSNTDLTGSRVRNYKRMEKRRVAFNIGITYQTSKEKVKQIPEKIKSIINSIKDTNFDRAHFSSFGDSSLLFEIVYYVLGPDYNKYMDIQQEINLKIMEYFEENQIEFAYPTQTLFINKE